MGAPPSINLLREIILLTGILSISFRMAVLLALSRFLAAGYSLYLYTSTQHGQMGGYINGVVPISFCNINSLFLHILPAILFIFSSQYIVMWV